MPLDHSVVRLDFGQGQSDRALYDAAAAIRTQVCRLAEPHLAVDLCRGSMPTVSEVTWAL